MPEDPSAVGIIPVRTERKSERFDLGREVWLALHKNSIVLQNQDILAVSSKFASISEGRIVDLASVIANSEARALAKKYAIEPSLARLIIEESESILGGIPGFVLSIVHGTIAPNAGIDRSNVPQGSAVLYPRNPAATARLLRKKLLRYAKKEKNTEKIRKLGVILTDSRVTPTRLGTVGVALSTSGIRPTIDMRGTDDLYGSKLKVTLRAIADQAATAAQLVMGEAGESTPIAIIRNLPSAFEKSRNEFERNMIIPADKCLILSGLGNGLY